MNKLLRIIILYILVLPVFLSACGGADKTQSPTATATPKPTIQLTPCTVGSIQPECGYLHVSEDRNNPNGRTWI
jgi:hypothetical protein